MIGVQELRKGTTFELDGELWMLIYDVDGPCWVPEAQVERVDACRDDIEG